MIEPYKKVSEFCDRAGLSFQIRNHAFCLFVATLEKALRDHEAKNRSPARPKEVTDKQDALLTEDCIKGYVSRAEAIVDTAAIELRAPYEKAFNAKQFWISVGASVLAGFLYSLLLILIFWIAHDQITSWLTSLTKSNG